MKYFGAKDKEDDAEEGEEEEEKEEEPVYVNQLSTTPSLQWTILIVALFSSKLQVNPIIAKLRRLRQLQEEQLTETESDRLEREEKIKNLDDQIQKVCLFRSGFSR